MDNFEFWTRKNEECESYKKRVSFDVYNDWDSLSFKGMNWRNFTFFYLNIETAGYKNLVIEFTIAFMGFHCTVEWHGR